jgi:hypothetical protein
MMDRLFYVTSDFNASLLDQSREKERTGILEISA